MVILFIGYALYYISPLNLFLSTSESLDKADKELINSSEYINRAINLTEQRQYDKAREMLKEAENSSRSAKMYIEQAKAENISVEPYEKGKNYLDKLIICIKDITSVIELTEKGESNDAVKYIDKFLSEFRELEGISSDIIKKYPALAEKLNIKKTMVNLKPLKYDSQDFKDEYIRNKTAPLPPISFDGYTKEFKWKDHLGKKWSFEVKISERKYEKCKNLSHEVKDDEGILNFVTDKDAQINEIAEWFNNTYSNREDEANCILSFVQECIMSIPEEDIEYFRYPIETIVEGGDCEDKSILFVSIMKAEGYDIALVTFPYHEMGGVALREELKRVKNPEYRIPSYLFSIEAGLEDDLSKGVISEKLKIVFEKNSFPLSDSATVTSKREGEWNINDEEKFIIRRKEEELKVYYSPLSEKKKGYYLCETLERDFKIGSIPEEYKEMKYNVLVIPS